MYPPRASGIGKIGANAIRRKNRRSSGQRFGSTLGARTNTSTAAAKVTALMKTSTSRGRLLVTAKRKNRTDYLPVLFASKSSKEDPSAKFHASPSRVIGPRILPLAWLSAQARKERIALLSMCPMGGDGVAVFLMSVRLATPSIQAPSLLLGGLRGARDSTLPPTFFWPKPP